MCARARGAARAVPTRFPTTLHALEVRPSGASSATVSPGSAPRAAVADAPIHANAKRPAFQRTVFHTDRWESAFRSPVGTGGWPRTRLRLPPHWGHGVTASLGSPASKGVGSKRKDLPPTVVKVNIWWGR